MGSLGLETVLVGDVGDGVGLSVLWVHPAEGATNAQDRSVFLVGAAPGVSFNLGRFLTGLTVTQLIRELVAVKADVV